MNGIKKALNNIVENRIGDSRSSPRSIICSIWTGLGIDEFGSVFKVPGYDKIDRVVWVAPKDRMNAYIEGRWNPSGINAELSYLRSFISSGSNDSYAEEAAQRPRATKIPYVPEPSGSSVGSGVKDKISNQRLDTPLLMELAFFRTEVFRVELAPIEGLGFDRAAPGGYVDPALTEVIVDLNQSGIPDSKNARLLMHPSVDRRLQTRVPSGAGISEKTYRSRLSRIGIKGIKGRIGESTGRFNEMYNASCLDEKYEIAKAGDVWFEGVRSSITNGIVEFWVDDIGMGPMQRVGRNSVVQASARYYRETSAGQQRYATERDNPVSPHLASTAITPVKTYITDWFGDPSIYLGVLNAVMQLSAGLDENESSYKEKYYDLGAFDFDKIYNQYEGQTI